MPLALIAERQRTNQRVEYSRSVPQEEEQEVQHQEKEDRAAQRARADQQRALRDRLAQRDGSLLSLLSKSRRIDACALDESRHLRHALLNLREDALDAEAAGLQAV